MKKFVRIKTDCMNLEFNINKNLVLEVLSTIVVCILFLLTGIKVLVTLSLVVIVILFVISILLLMKGLEFEVTESDTKTDSTNEHVKKEIKKEKEIYNKVEMPTVKSENKTSATVEPKSDSVSTPGIPDVPIDDLRNANGVKMVDVSMEELDTLFEMGNDGF